MSENNSVSVNLDVLKDEILQELISEEFSLFRGRPGDLSEFPRIHWDTRQYPEYHAFLNTAKAAGVKLLIFSHRELEETEIEDAELEMEGNTLSREDRRDAESRLREMRVHVGQTSMVELAFHHGGLLYTFQVMASWYEEFMDMMDSLDSGMDDDDSSPLGGFYSNN